jgi:hypothetical protein
MKLMVDVRRAIQEYDLDSGTTKNYLIFALGGVEQKIEATEAQLQQAIVDAQVAGQNGGRVAQVHDFYRDRQPQLEELHKADEPEEPFNIEDLAEALLAEGHEEEEVLAVLQENFPEHFAQEGEALPSEDPVSPTLFEDFSGQATPEEMAEFTSSQDVPASDIDVSTDDISGGGELAAIITGSAADRGEARRHPITGARRQLTAAQAARVDAIRTKPHLTRSKRDAMNALRAKALRTPSKTVPADDAGNPIAPQIAPPVQPQTKETFMPSLPGFDDDGFAPG